MRTEPQFWSKAYDPVECTVEPLEQSQDWHKVVTICEIWCCCLFNHVTEMVFEMMAKSQKVFHFGSIFQNMCQITILSFFSLGLKVQDSNVADFWRRDSAEIT